MNHRNKPRLYRALASSLIVVILLLAAGCRPQTTPKPTDTGVTPIPSQPAETLPTETPAATATVEANKAVLLALPGADTGKVIALQEMLAELTAQEGLTLETVQELDGTQLDPAVRLVIALPPDPGILNLAAANPQVQFLAIGIPGVQSAQNLSAVFSGGDRPDQQGFLGGYLAAMLTPDWRVGVISAPDSPAGKANRNGFANGVVFYCGLCRPAYPPFVQYPVFADIPSEAGDAELQAAVDALRASAVKTVYVSPGVGQAALLEKLAAADMQIIASGTPPPSIGAAWIASVSVDEMAALRTIWPHWIAGEAVVNLDVPLALTERNPERFSPGRQQFLERILADLLAGYIDTGVDPQTGDPK